MDLKPEKREILKFLSQIGVDTRFISYTAENIYINNLRFSKFSRKKESIFKNRYPDIGIIRSSLFQKICSKSSKNLKNSLEPKETIYLLKPVDNLDQLINIILEPYTRKYGISIIQSEFTSINDAVEAGNDNIVSRITLNNEVYGILDDLFNGDGIVSDNKDIKIISPLINVSNEWINSFLDSGNIENKSEIKYEDLPQDFMLFLEDIVPDYKENILKVATFLRN